MLHADCVSQNQLAKLIPVNHGNPKCDTTPLATQLTVHVKISYQLVFFRALTYTSDQEDESIWKILAIEN